jgi:uncharacterized protein YyaL (SSP411 family)
MLMGAFSTAGRVCKNEEYIKSAEGIFNFIEEKMVLGGNLHHRYRNNDLSKPVFLDDYAFYILGLIELYKTSFDAKYLSKAKHYSAILIKNYYDKKKGGFFLTPDDAEKLPVRWKDTYDGAVPSGNSAALKVMISLYHFLGEPLFFDIANDILNTFAINVTRTPAAHSFFIFVLEPLFYPSYELVIVGETENDEIRQALVELSKPAYDNVFVILKDVHNKDILTLIAPFTKTMTASESGCSFFLCTDSVCSLPVYSANELFLILEK